MRVALFIAAIVQSASLLAQPTLSEEVVSDPLTPHVAAAAISAPAVAMARDNAGVAIAWSMANAAGVERVYVARLDSTAHVRGALRELPVIEGAKVDAVSPSMAPAADGNGFVIAFEQADSVSPWAAVYVRLDDDLNASVPIALSNSVSSPVIVRTGGSTWLTVDGRLWRLSTNGSELQPQRASFPPALDMTVTGNDVRTVGFQKSLDTTVCTCGTTGWPWNFCLDYVLGADKCHPTIYTPSFTQLNDASDAMTLSFPANLVVNNPAVQSDGRTLLLAWFEGKTAAGGFVRAGRSFEPAPIWPFVNAVGSSTALGPFGALDTGATATAIATDGRRFVVVWRTAVTGLNHDVLGAVVDEDGTVAPLTIASSPADEIDPSVVALARGVFLIAYEKNDATGRRIAGRILSLGQRMRSVR